MPASFAGVRNKTPLEFLSGIPGPFTVSEDLAGLLKAFGELPAGDPYRAQLLENPVKHLGGEFGRLVSRGLPKMLKGLPKGEPGLGTAEADIPGGIDYIYRSLTGDPVGFLRQAHNKVDALAIDPNAAPSARASALLQLATQAIKNRLDPGYVTDMGGDMITKLRQLAQRQLRRSE